MKRTTMAQNATIPKVPVLPEQMIAVRAKNGAVVYTMHGSQIPEDTFVAVPVSPGVIKAIQAGDLEEGKHDAAAPKRTHVQHHRRTEAGD